MSLIRPFKYLSISAGGHFETAQITLDLEYVCCNFLIRRPRCIHGFIITQYSCGEMLILGTLFVRLVRLVRLVALSV